MLNLFNLDENIDMALITKKPFTEWILVFAKLYFLPIGRVGRIDFLIAFVTVMLIAYFGVIVPGSEINVNIIGIDILKMTKPTIAEFNLPPGKEYLNQLVGINTILCFWILLTNAVKRLRDLDSKIWYFILIAIPVVNLFIILTLMLSEGTLGINQYGPQKKPLSL